MSRQTTQTPQNSKKHYRPNPQNPHRIKGKRVNLTRREYRLIVGLRKGKSKKQAALDAGYSRKDPNAAAYHAVSNIQAKVGFDIWEAAGFTFADFIKKHLMPGLSAKKTIFAQDKGKFTDKRQVEDNAARHQSRRLFAEIAGILKTEQENTGPSFKVVVINADNRPPRPANSVTIPTAAPALPSLDQEK